MKRTARMWTGMTLLALLAVALPAAAGDHDPGAGVDHSAFDTLLAKYVAEDGVRYRAWHDSAEDRQALKDYVDMLAASRPGSLPRYQALAFWLNAYNAVTLDLVLDHYPVKSIKDIKSLKALGSPWRIQRITVEGRELSLNEIENDIIRKRWREPRVHFALNCASVSCPPLRAGAYSAPGLHEQLEEQTAAFLADGKTTYVDEKGRLHLSQIFQWYGGDFEQENSTVVDWVRPYVPALAKLPPDAKVKVEFGSYDWRLNEASE